jgi:TonB-dependent receptor
MQPHTQFCRLAGCASALAIMIAASPVLAQDASDDEIVVTGQALANARAIDVKRSSIRIIDAVAADDIGNLPDFNAGDALKRVTGVNVLTYQGEPRFITIRAFNADYITSTIDGFQIASPDPDGRKLFTEVLPSSLAGRIEVLKTGAPDVDGHAVGGYIDFISRDIKALSGSPLIITGRGGAYFQPTKDGGDAFSGEADFITGAQFGSDNEFTLVATGSIWNRGLWVPQIESGGQRFFYNADGTRNAVPYAGNGIGVPTERRWYIYDNDRTRFGGNTRLSWEASDAFETTLGAYYYRQNETSDRYETTAQVQTGARVTNQSATAGTLSNVNQLVQLGQFNFTREVFGANIDNEIKLGDRSKLTVATGWSAATLENPQIVDIFQRNGLTFSYDESGGFPIFTAADPTVLNAATYPNLRHREERQSLTSDLYELRADYELGANDQEGFGFKAGAKFVRSDRDVRFTRTDFTGLTYNLSSVLSDRVRCPFGCAGNGDYFTIDQPTSDRAFEAARGTARTTLDQAATFGGTYGLREDIAAGYVLGRYVGGGLSAIAGVRYEATDITSNGFRRSGTVYSPLTGASDYGHWLPSATFAYEATSDFKLRGAYARTIGRPRFGDEATRGEVLNDTGSQPTLSRSNPNLRPRLSDNFDLGAEYYLDGGNGILSVGLFHKRIKGEIFTFGQIETVSINGVDRSVLVTQARNSERDAKVSGIEIGLVKQIDFLPGFSIAANATFLDVDWPVTLADGIVIKAKGLPEQASEIYNLSLLYDRGPLHGRIAWNHTGELWDTRFSNFTNANEFYRNRYQPAIDQIDLQLRYDVSKKFSLTIEAQNITDEGLRQTIGRDQEFTLAIIDYAPAVLVGASYRF